MSSSILMVASGPRRSRSSRDDLRSTVRRRATQDAVHLFGKLQSRGMELVSRHIQEPHGEETAIDDIRMGLSAALPCTFMQYTNVFENRERKRIGR